MSKFLRLFVANLGRRLEELAGDDSFGETLVQRIKETWL